MENRIARKHERTTYEWRFESLAGTPRDSLSTAATSRRAAKRPRCVYSAVEKIPFRFAISSTGI